MHTTTAPSAGGTATAPDWATWHLHLASTARPLADRVVCDVVAPVARELGVPWFFLRYWQGGPHVRLRIRDLDPTTRDATQRELAERLSVTGRLRADEAPFRAADYGVQASRLAHAESAGGVDALRPPGVHPAQYVPEVERYGGPLVTRSTEALFHLSSELVLDLLPQAADSRRRTALALRAAASAAAALGGADAQARYYAAGLQAWQGWNAAQGLAPDRIAQLCEVGRPDGTGLAGAEHGRFAQWHEALAGLVAELRARGRAPGPVVLSHVHMFCNRLWRSLVDELQTYAWLTRAFPVPTATSGAA